MGGPVPQLPVQNRGHKRRNGGTHGAHPINTGREPLLRGTVPSCTERDTHREHSTGNTKKEAKHQHQPERFHGTRQRHQQR